MIENCIDILLRNGELVCSMGLAVMEILYLI